MYGYINGIDFNNLETEKYWSFPAKYNGDAVAESKYMATCGQYVGSEKKDGHYFRFIKDEEGNMILHGRDKGVGGEYLNKYNWVPQFHKFFESLPNGTCLLGEVYFPNNRGSRNVTTIMGCLEDKAISRQNAGEKLNYYVFDVWAYNGTSHLNTKVEDRIKIISTINPSEYVQIAKYLEGEELWNELGEILSRNGEGIVITKKGSVPTPGKRPARKTLKIKMEIEKHIDAFIDGAYKPANRDYDGKELETWEYWVKAKTDERLPIGPYYKIYCEGAAIEPVKENYYKGWAGSISFSLMRNGKPEHFMWISNVTDALKQEIVEHNENCIGRVAEITGMELEKKDDTYSLRHSRIFQWRPDKNYLDCDFSQIEEN